MLDLMPSLSGWRPAVSGERCAVATIVAASGSVPRPPGTSMLVSETGRILGSLSGGCVEGAVVESALEVMADGGSRLEHFGYSREDAFAVGLTCGGELEVHIQPLGSAPGGLRLENLQALAGHEPAAALALIRRVDARGGGAVVIPDPATYRVESSAELAALLGLAHVGARAAGRLMLAAAAQLEPLLRGGRTGLVRLAPPEGCLSATVAAATPGEVSGTGSGTPVPQSEGTSPEPATLLVESRLPAARMLVFGANDFGAALLPAAKLLGYRVTLCDARPAFSGQDRFAAADDVATDWPDRYLAAEASAGRVDSRTVVCVLTHDPKFDIPLLRTALGLDVAFVGAMGSRRSHRQRVDALLEAGVTPAQLARLHSPIGLDLGAVTPAEVAVSITAELIAARSGAAACPPLKDGTGPIHHRPAEPRFPSEPRLGAEPARQETAWT
ncbi:xanthine dehydrogenase [Arthrobacter sp. Soil736]|uniref:XdhC family protein n=1 Tax=Arthrobacter sp. Soil736 TaxID=1736395 RepID=UPI0006F2BD4A|nr:XdhC/CoxI family protein [Arthrobacter sp. Soil736]KRE68318.1 xanthine dehydrogenase [Arthrobacter sp. Soil736]